MKEIIIEAGIDPSEVFWTGYMLAYKYLPQAIEKVDEKFKSLMKNVMSH